MWPPTTGRVAPVIVKCRAVVHNHVSAVSVAVARSAFAINLNALDQWQINDNNSSVTTIECCALSSVSD